MPSDSLAPGLRDDLPRPGRADLRVSDDGPTDPARRAAWLEELGYDPKVEMDLAHHEGHGAIADGVWQQHARFLDLRLVRDGDDNDDLPDMPPILGSFDMTPRWESFCRLYGFGYSATDAARHAGYAGTSAAQAGWRLLQDPRIQRRIRELKEFIYETRPRTRIDLVVRLEAIYREAMARGQYNAAIRAIEGVARMEGVAAPKQAAPAPESPAPAGRK